MGEDVGRWIGGLIGMAAAAVVLVIWLAMKARKRPANRRGDEDLGAATPARQEELPAADTYFRLAGLILAARATGQYEEAMLLAKHAWPLIPRALQGELAGVDPQEIPAIDGVLDLLVAADDEQGLTELLSIVSASERLSALRRNAVEAAAEDLARSRRIVEAVARQPGILQKDRGLRLPRWEPLNSSPSACLRLRRGAESAAPGRNLLCRSSLPRRRPAP